MSCSENKSWKTKRNEGWKRKRIGANHRLLTWFRGGNQYRASQNIDVTDSEDPRAKRPYGPRKPKLKGPKGPRRIPREDTKRTKKGPTYKPIADWWVCAGSRPGNHQLYHSSIQRREDKKEMKINTEKRDWQNMIKYLVSIHNSTWRVTNFAEQFNSTKIFLHFNLIFWCVWIFYL